MQRLIICHRDRCIYRRDLFVETGPVELVLYTEKEVLEALKEISDHPVYSQILHLYFKEVITDQQRQAH